MTRTPALAAALALTAALGTALAATAGPGLAAAAAAHHTHVVDRGGPGKWTKVSTGTVDTDFQPSMVRSTDGVLHLVYPKHEGSGVGLSHTSIHTDGSIARQSDVLATGWSVMDVSPIIVSGAGDLRVVFAGQMTDVGTGFWDHNQIYTATSDNTGNNWNLPAEAIGPFNGAPGLYGTAATTLPDGTPIAAFTLNNTLYWHVGTGSAADSTYVAPGTPSMYGTTIVRDGAKVWAGWFQFGSTARSTGIFAKQILPTVGPTLKAPGSSHGVNVVQPNSRVALAARAGGGVFEAYCVGYPTCTGIRVWKVGTHTTADVPHSRFVSSVAMSPGPAGRLWIAWTDNLPKVRAVRTGRTGLAMGAVRNAGLPKGGAAYALAIDGTRGRGDIVLNDGNGLWHTQVLAGLTVKASPSHWRRHHRQKVTFTVTDAHSAVGGSKVTVGSARCTTNRRGRCSITFPASYAAGKHTVRATRAGYAPATTGVRVS